LDADDGCAKSLRLERLCTACGLRRLINPMNRTQAFAVSLMFEAGMRRRRTCD
jgi:hypothetical protein